jgi:radical SAM superfamily enzyme YgiQ (UPF0313 family)|tara:strand:+ start:17078 stop:18499 length:1422 start_codon:yes stop_codon:yes gene_type:complete
MKVTLINPPMTLEERYGKFARAGSSLPPLGLAYIAATLEKNGIEVDIIDGTVMNFKNKSLENRISSIKPDIIGVTALTPTLYRSYEVINTSKKILPRTLIVIGGPHTSLFPKDVLKENTNIDISVYGEGEHTLLELVKNIENYGKNNGKSFEDVKGIVYRNNGKIIKNEPRPYIGDLDTVPFPSRHLLPMNEYRPALYQIKRSPNTNIIASRGCPFSCTFCSKGVYGKKFRTRSPENVIVEIENLIEKYGIKELLFWDDTFTVNKKWVEDFCDLLQTKNFDLTWSCSSRVNKVDKALLQKMKNVGCWSIFYGIEAGSQELLDNIDKGITLQEIRNAVKWAKEVGIEVRASFMLGLPGETKELAKKTIRFAKEIDPDFAQFNITTPYPGTELNKNAGQYGKILSHDFSKYTIWSPIFIPTGITSEDLTKLHHHAYVEFYLRPTYILKRLMKIRSFSDIKVYLNGFVTLLLSSID